MENYYKHQKYYSYYLWRQIINKQEIDWSFTVKYLGIILDSRLNFNNHATQTCDKARRIRAALFSMFN